MLKNNLRRLVLLALALGLVFGLAACGKKDENAVAIVDGDSISLDEFYENYEMVKAMYEMQLGEGVLDKEIDGVTVKDQIADEIIGQLVLERVILNDAAKRKIEIADGDLEAKIKEYVDAVGGEENFKEYLEANNVKEETFRKDIKNIEIMNKHKEAIMNEVEVTEKESKTYYDENTDSLEQVRARHILVQTEEEAKTIKGQLDQGGKFEDLAKEKSKDVGSAIEGGDLGYFKKGEMIKEFEEVAFSIEAGKVSDPVKTDVGYHIIKVEDKKDSYETLKDDIEGLIKEQKYAEEIQKLEKKAKVEKFSDRIKLDKKEDKPEDKPEEVKEENKAKEDKKEDK